MIRRGTILLLLVVLPATALAQGSVPVRVLSSPTGRSADAFTSINSVRELSNGKVIVSDMMDKSVHLVDLAAGTSAPIGREGQGPGEYGFPGELFPLAGDTTLLVDRMNRRFLTLLPNGKTGASVPFPAGNGFSDARGIDAQGRIYFNGSLFSMNFTPGEPTPDSIPLTRWDHRRNLVDTVTFLKVPSMNLNISGGSGNSRGRTIMFRAQPFAPEDAWSVAPDGRVGVARVLDYHIEWFSPARQRTAGPANKVAPVRVTDADKEALRKQMASSPRMMVAVGSGGTSTRSAGPPPDMPAGEEPQYPEYKPAFPPRSVWMTPEGMLWVLRSRPANDLVPLIDVFDQRGNLVGQVKLPQDRRVIGFGKGVVYLAYTDSDDLQWLERYRR
ncbi:MAG TPA: hypothetical protein VGP80_01135 [Gemmatimonadales bacterium]|nr:hypothetical protein [Gemmatimonadales bacterium]